MRHHTKGAGLALLVVGVLGCASKEETGMKIYVQQKLYDKAILQGSQALAQNPNDGDTHYFLGLSYYGKDQDLPTEAAGYADSAALWLGKAYTHFTKARELAEASWGASADDGIVSMWGRHYNRGIIATKNGDHKTASAEYYLATVADPENYKGFYAHASALRELALAARKANDDAEFQRMSAIVVEDLDRVLDLGADDKETTISVYHTKGEVLYKRGDMTGAQEAYKRAVGLSPDNYNLITTIAERYYNDQDWQNAAAYFQDALSIKERLNLIGGEDAMLYTALGTALSKLDRRPEAVLNYEKSLALKPNDEPNLYNVMVLTYKMGEEAEKSGDMATAKQHYSRAVGIGDQLIAVNPKQASYWQVRGLCKRGLGDFAGAARDLNAFKELQRGATSP